MKFEPKSAKEIAEAGLYPAGEYEFEVADAIDGVSKASGNDMITLKLRVYNDEGSFIFISDYLLESVAYKLRHACEATGLIESYETGALDAEDFIGKTGKLKLRIDKDKTGQYPDKNGVQDYIARNDAPAERSATRSSRQPARKQMAHANLSSISDLDDEIPF